MEENKKGLPKKEFISEKLIAKKDFRIVHNEVDITIKEGDDLSKLKLETKFIPNLKTEKII